MADQDQRRDALHLSVSQVRSYLRCGRAYQLRYVVGSTPAFKPLPFALGSAFHAALARFYVAVKEDGTPPNLELVNDTFRDAWKLEVEDDIPLQQGEDDSEDQGALLDKGIEMLSVFHQHAVKSLVGVAVEAVERPFSVPLFDPDTGVELEERLNGVLDLVVKKGRRRTIVEHKSSARRYSDEALHHDIQASAYSFAGRALGMGNVGVTFQIVTKSKTPAVQIVDLVRDEDDELEFQRVAVNVMRAVDAGAFPPVRGWQCKSCPFQHVCRPPRPKLAEAGQK